MLIFNIIILLGIVQGFLLALTLATVKKGNKKANNWLSILIFLFSVSISNTALYNSGFYQYVPHILMIGRPLLFLVGPIFYIYVKILTTKDFRFKFSTYIHFIPFLINTILLIPFFLLNAEEKIVRFQVWCTSPSILEYLETSVQIIHVFIYLYLINKIRRRHAKQIKETFSSIEKINLSWIKKIFTMYIIVFLVFTILIIISAFGNIEIGFTYGSVIIGTMVSICIYSIGYLGLRQPEIIIGIEESGQQKKYEKSTLTPENSKKYLNKLLRFMESERPYTNSLLTIVDLSKQTSIPSYYLSQIINEKLNQNFYDFINRYRIEDAKRRLLSEEYLHLNIMAIAYDVGFNSKSVFNTAFKKLTNMTPSQFRQNALAA